MFRRLSFYLLSMLFLLRPCKAQDSIEKFDDRLQIGIDLYMNYQFEEADSFFRSLAMEDPDHPVPAFYLLVNETARYRCAGRFRESADILFANSPGTLKILDAWADRHSDDARVYLYIATARSLASRVYMNRTQYIPALKTGIRAIRYADRSSELDPDFYDAGLALGTFDIFVSVILQHYPLFKPMFGDTDYRSRGIQRLERARENGRESWGEATLLLQMVQLYEQEDFQKALTLGQSAVEKYPGNLEMGSLFCESLIMSDRLSDAGTEMDRLRRIISASDDPQFISMWRIRLEYLQGVYDMKSGDLRSALQRYRAVLDNYKLEFGWQKAMSLYYSGTCYASLDEDREARRYFKECVDSGEVCKAVLNAKKALSEH